MREGNPMEEAPQPPSMHPHRLPAGRSGSGEVEGGSGRGHGGGVLLGRPRGRHERRSGLFKAKPNEIIRCEDFLLVVVDPTVRRSCVFLASFLRAHESQHGRSEELQMHMVGQMRCMSSVLSVILQESKVPINI